MKKSVKVFKQFISLLLGVPVFIIGIILIPLPGPGILLCLLGLFILSYGFDGAKVKRDKYVEKIKNLYEETKEKQKEYFDKIDKK